MSKFRVTFSRCVPFNGKSLKKLREQYFHNKFKMTNYYNDGFKLKNYNNLLFKICCEYVVNVVFLKKFSSKLV